MVGYETHGYIYTAPHVNVSGISSGTEIRRLLGSPKVKKEERPKRSSTKRVVKKAKRVRATKKGSDVSKAKISKS